MKASDNGICPHCGRQDVVEVGESEREEARRFLCRGCNAVWMGVRRRISPWCRVA